MIAVTFALPAESSAFLRLLQSPVRSAAGSHVVSGTLHGRPVCVLHTGVGEKITRSRLSRFLQEQTPELLISAGFAGALGEHPPVGTVFMAENFSDAEAAQRCELPRARLATVSTVIESAAERESLVRRTGAVAVDMETEWIAEMCRAASIPLIAVRVISDSPAEPLPAPAGVLFDVDRQRTPALKLAGYLVRHPASFSRLVKFTRQIAVARQRLADALVQLCAR